jgi:predicted Zn-dependent protease with MMP-like domain
MTWSDRLAPSLDDFAALAKQVLNGLPADFHARSGEVAIRVEDFPSEAMLDDQGIEDPFALTGLYQGADPSVLLFRRPILDEWAERGDISLGDLISQVLVDELGGDASAIGTAFSAEGWLGLQAPTPAYFAEIANRTLTGLPPAIRSAVGETRVIVEDFADSALLASLDIEDPFELTGVYEGVDLTQRSVLDLVPMPSTIRLFRRPILDEWFDSDTGIASLIEHVFVHEVAHHFGYSDADIERVEG